MIFRGFGGNIISIVFCGYSSCCEFSESLTAVAGASTPSNLYAVEVLASVGRRVSFALRIDLVVEHEARRRETAKTIEARSIINSSIFL